jgi:hypothetical protein
MISGSKLVQDHERDLCSRILAGQSLTETDRAWLAGRLAAARARAEASVSTVEPVSEVPETSTATAQ